MTALATEPTPDTPEMPPRPPHTGCVLTMDASYAARLAHDGDSPGSWFPERWTLDGPEPYAVPLPGNQPEEPGTAVQPLTDGRVLIQRTAAGRQMFSLLYPTGPGTGEVPLGAVECEDLTLLPPTPDGRCAYALSVGETTTQVWQVAGGSFGPELLAEVPGHCSGGVWLSREARLLALDRGLPESAGGGPVKTVVVDLDRGGEVSPLLQIAEESEDRLLVADLDSGLILLRSDAASPGELRLGWGVLGSTLPIRFPDSLRLADCELTPFAVQPGQSLMPEGCAVALHVESAEGGSPWLGLWRPAEGVLHQVAAPGGWLPGSGFFSREGLLSLPCVTEEAPCGLARIPAPEPRVERPEPAAEPEPPEPAAPRPVPLAQAPLGGRGADR
ncbi:hypothetical protein ABZY90_07165 [Streptomyces sp. NPDC006422]|uniref:hypothetical protein n=1 Tax=unclassified Streptomyces TaxID=2593676 RepID=UPI0033A6F5EB